MFNGFEEFVRGHVTLETKRITVSLNGTLSDVGAEYVKAEVYKAARAALQEMMADMKVIVDTTQNVAITKTPTVMVQSLGSTYFVQLDLQGT